MKQGIFARGMSAESSEQIIDIIGVIGWEVGYQTLREILRAIPANTKSVLFDIYSPGGDVWEGNGIVQEIGELSKRGIKTSAKIQVAASMATLIAVACESRSIAANGRFLIHNAWAGVTGDAAEMEKMAKTLRDCEQEAAKFYAERTGKKTEEMLTLMAEERWMMPEEVLKMGFVQAICDPFKPEEYNAVKEEIMAAGKWPKALVELPPEPAKEEIKNASTPTAGTVDVSPAAKGKPELTADESGYIRGLAQGETQRQEEQEKFSLELAKRDKLIREHQSEKDKALAKILDIENQLAKKSAEMLKAKEEMALNLAKTLSDLAASHQKDISSLIEKSKKDCDALNTDIKKISQSLKDANDRNSKLIAGSMTFEPNVETWEEAMKACQNDYVKARARYPEIHKQLLKPPKK